MKNQLFYRLIIILSSIGILLSLYLLWQQFYHPAFQPCNINSFINCNAIISGEVAKTFGIPTPLYGLIGYIVIFLAATFQNKKLLLSMASFGLIFCLSIAYKELVVLKVICPICITCQILMITIFTMSIILNRSLKTTADIGGE